MLDEFLTTSSHHPLNSEISTVTQCNLAWGLALSLLGCHSEMAESPYQTSIKMKQESRDTAQKLLIITTLCR